MHHFSIDAFNLVGNLLHHVVTLSQAAISVLTTGTTASDLPPGIIG